VVNKIKVVSGEKEEESEEYSIATYLAIGLGLWRWISKLFGAL